MKSGRELSKPSRSLIPSLRSSSALFLSLFVWPIMESSPCTERGRRDRRVAIYEWAANQPGDPEQREYPQGCRHASVIQVTQTHVDRTSMGPDPITPDGLIESPRRQLSQSPAPGDSHLKRQESRCSEGDARWKMKHGNGFPHLDTQKLIHRSGSIEVDSPKREQRNRGMAIEPFVHDWGAQSGVRHCSSEWAAHTTREFSDCPETRTRFPTSPPRTVRREPHRARGGTTPPAQRIVPLPPQ